MNPVRRSASFKIHLAAYFGLAVVLVVANLIISGAFGVFRRGGGAPDEPPGSCGHRRVLCEHVRQRRRTLRAQVSMNLTNYEKTPIPRVLETIRMEAARHGVMIAGTEIIVGIKNNFDFDPFHFDCLFTAKAQRTQSIFSILLSVERTESKK